MAVRPLEVRELIITFRALPELQGIELSNKENNTKNKGRSIPVLLL